MNATEIWTMVTAIATCALAIFAVLAWRASAHNLAIMQTQLQVTEKATASQIADQEWGRQVEALARYLRSLTELSEAAPIKPYEDYKRTKSVDGAVAGGTAAAIKAIDDREDLNGRIGREVETSGAIWHLLHRSDSESVEALEDLEEEIMMAFWLVKTGRFSEEDYREAAGLLIDFIQEWQAKPHERIGVAEKAKSKAAELRKQRGPDSAK